MQNVLTPILNLVGADHVLQGDALLSRDPGVHPDHFRSGVLVRPQDVSQLSAVLKLCSDAKQPVVVHGGRTGLSHGAVTEVGELIISMERFNRIRSIDATSRTAVVEAGVTLAHLDHHLAEHALTLGLDLGARDSATLGGLAATNAGGNEAFRYGTMRERVLGLEVVLANGDVLCELHQVRKCNEGFSLEKQFIGSEGCLGVITAVSLELVTRARFKSSALLGFADYQKAVECVSHARVNPDLAAAEVLCRGQLRLALADAGLSDRAPPEGEVFVLLEFQGDTEERAYHLLEQILEQAFAAELLADAWIAQNERDRQLYWRLREDWAVDRHYPGGLWYDVSIPPSHINAVVLAIQRRLAEFDRSLQLFVVGHLADGNLHFTVNAERPLHGHYDAIAALITAGIKTLGGSFSAEHGIGLEKKATLLRESSATKLKWMRALKTFWDPHHILNRGKVVPL